MSNLNNLSTLIEEPICFSGEENPLLNIIFPLTDKRTKNVSGLRMHFVANVLRPFHEYIELLDGFFSTKIDKTPYFYFIINEKQGNGNIIAEGQLFHYFCIPSSDEEDKKLEGKIAFYADGYAEIMYFQEEEKEEGFVFEKVCKKGPWKEIFQEYLEAIIVNFEISMRIFPKTSEVTEQEIEKLRRAIDYLN